MRANLAALTTYCQHCRTIQRLRRLNRAVPHQPETIRGEPIPDLHHVGPRRVAGVLACGHNKEFISSRGQLWAAGVAA